MGSCAHLDLGTNIIVRPSLMGKYIYTTIGELSSKFEEFLAERSQFDSGHDQMSQACADRSGNGSYLNKLAP